MMLQGMTARYLLYGCYRVKAGDRILIQAAAGGVGLIVCQWAKYLGATVIGTVGSPEKADLAANHGCDYPILYRDENFVSRVKEITKDKGLMWCMIPWVNPRSWNHSTACASWG